MYETKKIHEIAERKSDEIARIQHSIFDLAEYGYEVQKSASYLEELLEKEGFQVERGIGDIETAFVGTYGSGKPVIGILAEYDALPNLSQKAGETKRCPIEGKAYGHACGHSALAAGTVGAAIVAKEYLKETGKTGTVKVFGCPAEETGFGKSFMVKRGCFEGLDMCFTWHPMDRTCLWGRTLGYYKVRFDFKGTASHAGGAPELGRSALDACELMNVGVNYLREHIISSARVHYAYLDAGGDAPNIVQDHASLLYFVRAPRLADSAAILERVKKIAQGAALMTETQVHIKVLGGMSDNIPNPTASRILSDAFVAEGGPDFTEEEFAIARRFLDILSPEEREKAIRTGAKLQGISEEEFAKRPLVTRVEPVDERSMERQYTASTDVGDVSYNVPTSQYAGTTSIPGTGLHTWQFAAQVGTSIGDKGSVAVARAIARACAEVWENTEVVKTAKEELLETTGGVYVSPLPDDVKPGEGM